MDKNRFQLFVALPTDDVCTVKNLSENIFVYQLRSKIELKTGIPGEILRLYFMNAELLNEKTLGQCNLKHGCIIRIKLEANLSGLFEACWRGDIYDVFQNGVQYLNSEEFSEYNISLWNRLVVKRATHALFIACHRGYLGLILELLNHGAADINGRSMFGRTPLHFAAYQGFVGCVSLLLAEGAAVGQSDSDGKSPLTLAQENGHVFCEKRLRLYHWSLKTLENLSKREAFGSGKNLKWENESQVDFGSRSESADLPDTQKVSRRNIAGSLEGNELREARCSSAKKIQVQLPKVQTSNGDNLQGSREDNPNSARRPTSSALEAIAEKYRGHYRQYEKKKEHLQRLKVQDTTLTNNQNDTSYARKDTDESTVSCESDAGSQEGEEREHFDSARQLKNNTLVVTNDNERLETCSVPAIASQDVQSDNKKVEQCQNDISNGKSVVIVNEGQEVQEDEKTSIACKDVSQSHYKQRAPLTQAQTQSGTLKISLTFDKVSWSSRYSPVQTPTPKLSSDLNMNKTTPEEVPSSPQNKENKTEYFQIMSDYNYIKRRPPETYKCWLERKRAQAKSTMFSPPSKSNVGKHLDTETFKKWVASKRHVKLRESLDPAEMSKKTFIKTGLTFEQWRESKKGVKPRSVPEMIGESHEVQRHVPTSGKGFDEWLEEKRRLHSSRTSENDEANKPSLGRIGKCFEEWLNDKLKQKQIEEIHKLTTKKQEDKKRENELLKKYLNPHCMTFEEWLVVKRQGKLFERLRAQNDQKNEYFTPEERQEDANLVFNVWMTMKQEQELQDEEHKYCEMKAKWAAKEKENFKRLKIINKLKTKYAALENKCETKSC